MSLLQEVQSLLYGQSEEILQAVAVFLTEAKKTPVPAGNIIGAAKGEFVLPTDFLEQSEKMDQEITGEFYGDCQ